MNLDEKIGQMNQYNGFWDATGPTPQAGEQLKKYESLKKGLVGSMLNVRGRNFSNSKNCSKRNKTRYSPLFTM